MEWNTQKHEKFKHAIKSSSSSTKHSSILRLSLRQYVEPQIDITFTLLSVNSKVPTCLRVQCTFSASVTVLTTTSVQVSQDNCNNPSSESHTWPACDTKQLLKFRSTNRKTWKQTYLTCLTQQSFLFSCFVSKYSSKQFPLPTQFRSFPLTYSNTCSTQTLPQLQFKPRMLPDASEKSRSTFPNRRCPHVIFLSLRCQPTVSTPSSTVPSVPWRFLFISLSALQYLYCQANNNASGFNLKVTSQCKHPSSPTVPAHYRTSGVQLLTSLSHKCGK